MTAALPSCRKKAHHSRTELSILMIHKSMLKRLACSAAAVFVFTCMTVSATAQTSGVGNISGTVTDTTGAVVANAAVVVINTDTGVTRTLTTTGAGDYNAPFLQPGHYEVIVGGGNYSKVDRKNLVLTVGQVLSIDATLSSGSVQTTVDVTASTPILDTEKTEVSQTFDANLLANLPVATRNWSAFVLNTPNVVQDGGTGLVSFHGISGLYNQNYVDGSNNNQMLFSEARGRSSGAPYVYSIDSIKEFQAERRRTTRLSLARLPADRSMPSPSPAQITFTATSSTIFAIRT